MDPKLRKMYQLLSQFLNPGTDIKQQFLLLVPEIDIIKILQSKVAPMLGNFLGQVKCDLSFEFVLIF